MLRKWISIVIQQSSWTDNQSTKCLKGKMFSFCMITLVLKGTFSCVEHHCHQCTSVNTIWLAKVISFCGSESVWCVRLRKSWRFLQTRRQCTPRCTCGWRLCCLLLPNLTFSRTLCPWTQSSKTCLVLHPEQVFFLFHRKVGCGCCSMFWNGCAPP